MTSALEGEFCAYHGCIFQAAHAVGFVEPFCEHHRQMAMIGADIRMIWTTDHPRDDPLHPYTESPKGFFPDYLKEHFDGEIETT